MAVSGPLGSVPTGTLNNHIYYTKSRGRCIFSSDKNQTWNQTSQDTGDDHPFFFKKWMDSENCWWQSRDWAREIKTPRQRQQGRKGQERQGKGSMIYSFLPFHFSVFLIFLKSTILLLYYSGTISLWSCLGRALALSDSAVYTRL